MIKEVSKLFVIDDIVVYPIIKDTEKHFECAEGIRLHGVKQISLTYKLEQKEAKHPFEVCEQVKSITMTLDVPNSLLNSKEIESLNDTYCRVIAQILDDDGDTHLDIHKIRLSIKPLFLDKITYEITGVAAYPKHKFEDINGLIDIKVNRGEPVNLIAREDKKEAKSLSEKICEVCGIPECKVVFKGFEDDEPVYQIIKQDEKTDLRVVVEHHFPDFERDTNKLKLINLLIENDHIITMNKYYYSIGNGDTDFINDCYNEYFEVGGSSFLEALYNYLTRWIKQSTRFKKEDGTMFEYIDTSHTLEREDCYYPEGFDDYLKDIEKIKSAIRQKIEDFYFYRTVKKNKDT